MRPQSFIHLVNFFCSTASFEIASRAKNVTYSTSSFHSRGETMTWDKFCRGAKGGAKIRAD
jgi:hypothetical protein